MMDSGARKPPVESAEIDLLRRSVAELAQEVQELAARTSTLIKSVESLSGSSRTGDSGARGQLGSRMDSAEPEADSDGLVPFKVIVSPVVELALAAVAETAIRGLPQVRHVLDIAHADQQATFELELEPGADLADSLQAAMPVPFEMVSVDDTEMVISLRSVWGKSESSR